MDYETLSFVEAISGLAMAGVLAVAGAIVIVFTMWRAARHRSFWTGVVLGLILIALAGYMVERSSTRLRTDQSDAYWVEVRDVSYDMHDRLRLIELEMRRLADEAAELRLDLAEGQP